MIKLVIPSIPPSSNHAYFTRGHARTLTAVGRAYKNETVAHLAQAYRKEMQMFKKNTRFAFHYRFWLETLENKLWKPEGKVNRYKKFDGGNLTKLLEDCFAKAGGFDDSQTMTSTWQKKQGLPKRTEVWGWNLDEEGDVFDYDFLLANTG